jgi:vanillate monooxygenase
MTFIKDTWYVACSADETDEKTLGRKVCNESIVFYRAAEGKVAALENFCPHRGAPLSLGHVIEGKCTCGYHGLEMGCDGKTISMPGQRVQAFPAIRSFPVHEQYGFAG